jgi:hypothetical protein
MFLTDSEELFREVVRDKILEVPGFPGDQYPKLLIRQILPLSLGIWEV